ncbi:hypothetical protein ACLKA7_007079 [Drosophila subpalustris]
MNSLHDDDETDAGQHKWRTNDAALPNRENCIRARKSKPQTTACLAGHFNLRASIKLQWQIGDRGSGYRQIGGCIKPARDELLHATRCDVASALAT